MRCVALASGVMFGVVALGAFGAHALKPTLEVSNHQGTWETAVLYQAIHGLALLGIGLWRTVDFRAREMRSIRAVVWLWAAGVVTFSGSLYAISLGGPKWLGPVTPIGGFCFLVGWLVLAVGTWRLRPSASPQV